MTAMSASSHEQSFVIVPVAAIVEAPRVSIRSDDGAARAASAALSSASAQNFERPAVGRIEIFPTLRSVCQLHSQLKTRPDGEIAS